MNLFTSPQKMVEKIHHEFDTAEERLLCEAQKIIAAGQEHATIEKAKRLQNVGFVNSALVVGVKDRQAALVTSKEQADLIMYYQQAYPLQKFITNDELDRICNKYGLVYAPVANYIKDVPDKNLRDIENAREVSTSDKLDTEHWIEITQGYYSRSIPNSQPRKFLLPKEIEKEYLGTTHSSSRWHILNVYLSNQQNSDSFFVQDHTCTTINKAGLFIAAPKSHFKLDGLKNKGKFGFLNISITEVKDPIVFRYVRGGLQIITKWGLEASDPIAQNPKDN